MELPTFAARMEWFSTACGLDLVAFGTKGDVEQIRDTAVAQPLLVAAGLAAAAELGLGSDAASELPAVELPAAELAAELVFAGHSVGELTAAALAGVLSQEQAVMLVAERGRAMAAASAATPTGMTAVLGGDREAVLATIAEHGLTAANDNGSGQVVAAGTMEQLAAFAADPPEKARLVPLSVAGAFHTHHMAPAVDHLAGLAASITPGEPTAKLLSNADGAVVDSGKVFLERLVSQVSSPVRWDLCSATLLDLGVTGMIELLPGGTLTGLAKRAMRGVTGVPLRTPDDLAGARALLTRGASS